MPSVMYPAQKEKVNDLGFPRTPDRLPELCGLYVQQSEVCETMTGTCGPYNLGGSTTYEIDNPGMEKLKDLFLNNLSHGVVKPPLWFP